MPTRKILWISSSWFNNILGNKIAIIAYMLGCDFLNSHNSLFTLHYLHIYEHVTQPLPLNLPFVNKTQDIVFNILMLSVPSPEVESNELHLLALL